MQRRNTCAVVVCRIRSVVFIFLKSVSEIWRLDETKLMYTESKVIFKIVLLL